MLNLEKPHSLEELSKDFPFLNHFFAKYFTPKERTVLSQVRNESDELPFTPVNFAWNPSNNQTNVCVCVCVCVCGCVVTAGTL